MKFEKVSYEQFEKDFFDTFYHNYKTIPPFIKKYVKGSAQKELMDFFNDYIDLNNLVRIVRMRKFYDLSAEYIFAGLMKYGSFSDCQLKAFINSPSDKQMMSDMKNTKFIA